jgi:hypothetical protein
MLLLKRTGHCRNIFLPPAVAFLSFLPFVYINLGFNLCSRTCLYSFFLVMDVFFYGSFVHINVFSLLHRRLFFMWNGSIRVCLGSFVVWFMTFAFLCNG